MENVEAGVAEPSYGYGIAAYRIGCRAAWDGKSGLLEEVTDRPIGDGVMRVLLIHQAFVGPDEPGSTRHYELAKSAAARGIDFTVVASRLSYLTGRRTLANEAQVTEQNLPGVRVLRAYAYPSLHRSFAWRVVSFLSFMLSSLRAAWL